MKKMFIEDKVYDVVDSESYYNNKAYYLQFENDLAIEKDNTVFPLRNPNSSKPGVVDRTVWLEYRNPTMQDKDMYSSDNILDFSSAKDLGEIAKLNEQYMDIERGIITDPDDNFKPPIKQQDSPEMVALKQAVSAKNINIKAYEKRFGPTFENDRRIFNGHKITLRKMREMCNALDIKATLTLSDINSNVDHPIGREITVNITGKGDDFNESDPS